MITKDVGGYMREVKRRKAKKNNSDVWLVASFGGLVKDLKSSSR
jgi:hypothetical protein